MKGLAQITEGTVIFTAHGISPRWWMPPASVA